MFKTLCIKFLNIIYPMENKKAKQQLNNELGVITKVQAYLCQTEHCQTEHWENKPFNVNDTKQKPFQNKETNQQNQNHLPPYQKPLF